MGQSLQQVRSSQRWARSVRKIGAGWNPLIKEVEGQVILGLLVIEFYTAKGIASHEILNKLLLYVKYYTSLMVGEHGRENTEK